MDDFNLSEARRLVRVLLGRRPVPADEKILEGVLRHLNVLARETNPKPPRPRSPDKAGAEWDDGGCPPEVWLG